jgi:tartrate-resistant acid phosphatase type 5
VKTFVEGTVCGNTDAYLCGHDHSMQWLTPTCNGTELLVSGAGAETTSLPGTNEARFQSTELGFIYGVATETQLSMQFVNDSGKPLFSRTLEKPGGAGAGGGSP